jgi:hypothetical protein
MITASKKKTETWTCPILLFVQCVKINKIWFDLEKLNKKNNKSKIKSILRARLLASSSTLVKKIIIRMKKVLLGNFILSVLLVSVPTVL